MLIRRCVKLTIFFYFKKSKLYSQLSQHSFELQTTNCMQNDQTINAHLFVKGVCRLVDALNVDVSMRKTYYFFLLQKVENLKSIISALF